MHYASIFNLCGGLHVWSKYFTQSRLLPLVRVVVPKHDLVIVFQCIFYCGTLCPCGHNMSIIFTLLWPHWKTTTPSRKLETNERHRILLLCSVPGNFKDWKIPNLVPRPSHRPAFDCLQYAKTEGGRPGIIYHVNDVSVYLGRQRGEGSPVERTS